VSKKPKLKITCRWSEPVDCSHILKLCKEGAPPNVINAEIRKMSKKAMKGEQFKLYVDGELFDYAPFRLQRRLDNICVICGRVPFEGEYMKATMITPWHCRFCKCPECGERSSKIKLDKDDDGFRLVCSCGWSMPVGRVE